MKIFKKWYFWVGLLVLAVIGQVVDKTDTKNNNSDSIEVEAKYIPGVMPVDVYLNLTNEGFSKEENFSNEYGKSWLCKKSYAGIDYEVSIFSHDINKIENVRATARIDVTRKNIIAVQQFLIYISSLPYENSNPPEAANWIKNNFNNDKATKIIGSVKFTILAPSMAVRMLMIEKAV